MVNNGSGWWFQPTPEKNMKVSWEYDIHNIWGKSKNVPNHQPEQMVCHGKSDNPIKMDDAEMSVALS